MLRGYSVQGSRICCFEVHPRFQGSGFKVWGSQVLGL